ncbi:MAG: DUF6285 domain-containing protein [Actinomycetota bacterium]|nr:DUF6285 domain-containing protein [Actinomycetota bacterium]
MSMHEEMDMALPPRGDTPYDAPSAQQLIEAVKLLITEDLDGEISQTQRWKLRIASNALGIASREIQNISDDRKAFRNFLDDLKMDSEKELSDALRSGEFDDKLEDVHAKLIPLIHRKLLVANPSYLIQKNDPRT